MMALDQILVFVLAGAGAYLGSYLQEKGKNFATREDIDKIVEQVQRTTKAAEDVKASISNDLWLRQKRWDLRRDVYAQLLEAFEGLSQSLSIMVGADNAARARAEVLDGEGVTFHKQRYEMARERAVEALRNARRAHALGGVFLTPETQTIVENLAVAWNKALEESSRGAVGAFSELSSIISRTQQTLIGVARKDLMEAAG